MCLPHFLLIIKILESRFNSQISNTNKLLTLYIRMKFVSTEKRDYFLNMFRCTLSFGYSPRGLRTGNSILLLRSGILTKGFFGVSYSPLVSYAYLQTYGLTDLCLRYPIAKKPDILQAPRANRSNEIILYYSDFANLY